MYSVANIALLLTGTLALRELVEVLRARRYRLDVQGRVLFALKLKSHPALSSTPVLKHVHHRFAAGVPARDTADELLELLGWWGPFDLG